MQDQMIQTMLAFFGASMYNDIGGTNFRQATSFVLLPFPSIFVCAVNLIASSLPCIISIIHGESLKSSISMHICLIRVDQCLE